MEILVQKSIHPIIGAENKHQIINNNWNYKSDVEAEFLIYHDEQNLTLKFFVQESNVKAIHQNINDPVYKDSCVEFFVSFDGKNYYNLEFNCIGNVLGGYGSGRHNREALSKELLQQIKTKPSLGRNRIEIIDRNTKWTLEVVIPKEVFKHEAIKSFTGIEAYCNFYKCGDQQAYPHYLSWSPISVEKPDFHRPEYFGKLLCEI